MRFAAHGTVQVNGNLATVAAAKRGFGPRGVCTFPEEETPSAWPDRGSLQRPEHMRSRRADDLLCRASQSTMSMDFNRNWLIRGMRDRTAVVSSTVDGLRYLSIPSAWEIRSACSPKRTTTMVMHRQS